MIPRKDVKINEHRIDVFITIFITWAIFHHLCNAWRTGEDGEMKIADTKIVLTTQQSWLSILSTYEWNTQLKEGNRPNWLSQRCT